MPTPPVIFVLNGPNLNLLGTREPRIYGAQTLDEIGSALEERAKALEVKVELRQSNHEGELVDAIHGARGRCAAIVINAGAFTHYAWALHDALATFEGPVVELHISNPAAREPWRHTSVLAPVVSGSISGFKGLGYELAVQAVGRLL